MSYKYYSAKRISNTVTVTLIDDNDPDRPESLAVSWTYDPAINGPWNSFRKMVKQEINNYIHDLNAVQHQADVTGQFNPESDDDE